MEINSLRGEGGAERIANARLLSVGGVCLRLVDDLRLTGDSSSLASLRLHICCVRNKGAVSSIHKNRDVQARIFAGLSFSVVKASENWVLRQVDGVEVLFDPIGEVLLRSSGVQ